MIHCSILIKMYQQLTSHYKLIQHREELCPRPQGIRVSKVKIRALKKGWQLGHSTAKQGQFLQRDGNSEISLCKAKDKMGSEET